jgi:hypothetical protein
VTAIEKVLHAVTREYGDCPSWQPLLDRAWAELGQRCPTYLPHREVQEERDPPLTKRERTA